MIQWAHFSRKANGLGMARDRDGRYAWITPIKFVMLCRNGKIYIIPNSVDALDEPALHHAVAFTRESEVDAAFATYQLMNSGGT